MLTRLVAASAALGLTVGIRINPPAAGEYQILIWIGPRLGERYEWTRRFAVSEPQAEALNSMAAFILDYCRRHEGWGRHWERSAPDHGLLLEASA